MLLSIEKVGRIYRKDWVALSDITLKVDKGEFIFLVGPSGAGKSTLLRLIYLQEFPDVGEIKFSEYCSKTIARSQVPYLRRKLGVVFQDFKLIPDMTAYENVHFALRVTEVPRKLRKKKAYELLSWVGLTHKRNSYPHELSGGEQQRIGIARALANDPLLILADEPTGNLDPEATNGVMKLLSECNKQGTAVIMATHDFNLVEKFNFKTVHLQEGIIIN
ncbi:ATP-binding cassette domain-containing protein [bacterium]|nr:ATP-binding cassette domain-containing protein [bacterium]